MVSPASRSSSFVGDDRLVFHTGEIVRLRLVLYNLASFLVMFIHLPTAGFSSMSKEIFTEPTLR